MTYVIGMGEYFLLGSYWLFAVFGSFSVLRWGTRGLPRVCFRHSFNSYLQSSGVSPNCTGGPEVGPGSDSYIDHRVTRICSSQIFGHVQFRPSGFRQAGFGQASFAKQVWTSGLSLSVFVWFVLSLLNSFVVSRPFLRRPNLNVAP